MCFNFGGNDEELKIAREAAAKAQARADAALKSATDAMKQAAAASAPAGDQESAQKAAESQWRKVVAEGTYTRNFGRINGLAPASVGYRMLTGELAA
jgi:cytochrome oxidase assembly protein ShyY1